MKIENLVRKNIRALKPYTSARGSHLDGILLDANENSLGSVVDRKSPLELNRYPDPNHKQIRETLGSYLGIKPANLFCGVGSDEIIDLLIRIFCEPGRDSVITLEPTYGMYKVACDINGVKPVAVNLTPDFQIDTAKTAGSFSARCKILFACSPNNPTGNLLRKKDVIGIAKKFEGIVVVDEAYVEFAESGSLIREAAKSENLVVLRTFSKAWGMAGVRFGYAVAPAAVIDYLYKIKAPYNMNKLSGAAVLKAIGKNNVKDKFVKKIIQNRDNLIGKLKAIPGIRKVYPTDTNFILFSCHEPSAVYSRLAGKGIIIRDRSSQIKGCLRVTVGTKQQNDYFLKELRKAL